MQFTPGMKATVIGLGVSGLSVVRFLLGQGVRVAVSDSRQREDIAAAILDEMVAADVTFELGGHSKHFVEQSDFVVPSPGVPLDLDILVYCHVKNIPVVGELGLAAGRFSVPVIAVTGSNGKTTVTHLISDLLAASGKKVFTGGNIGLPLLDYFNMSERADIVILEVSSFQLDLANGFRPDIALVLNISPDHLDRHGSMENYINAKLNICGSQQRDDWMIMGEDRFLPTKASFTGKAGYLSFGEHSTDALICDEKITLQVPGKEIESYDLSGTQLNSTVNRLNAAAALLAASLGGGTRMAMQSTLTIFIPPRHRMSEVAVIAGVRFINDSKATNLGAMQAALKSCGENVILIAGGRGKGGDLGMVCPDIKKYVTHLVLIGETAHLMQETFAGLVPVSLAKSMEQAVALAFDNAGEGDTVLLAPGCASFDMFKSYNDRGEVFSRAVLELDIMANKKQVAS